MVIRLLAKRLQTQYITQEENRMDVELKSLILIVSMFKSYGARYDLSKWKYLLESDIPISPYVLRCNEETPSKKI